MPQTAEGWRRQLARRRGPADVSYLLRRPDSRELVGVVNLSEIVRGVFQSADLSFCQPPPVIREVAAEIGGNPGAGR